MSSPASVPDPILALIGRGRQLSEELDATLGHHGLTLARYAALDALDVAGAPLSHRELGAALSRSSGFVTGLVDRLEGDGLVTRRRDRKDRRIQRVELTAFGRAKVTVARPMLVQRCATLAGDGGDALLAALNGLG